jgi:hypothetical protein
MSKKGGPMHNYEASLIVKTSVANDDGSRSLSPPIFVLCDTCYWCATYFDKTRTPLGNNCPQCNEKSNKELTNFPIMSNESFTFHYNDKTGVELEFKLR